LRLPWHVPRQRSEVPEDGNNGRKAAARCEANPWFPETDTSVEITAADNALLVTRLWPNAVGYFNVRGTPDVKGRLRLVGSGVSGARDNRGARTLVQFDWKVRG
jgi:hypothetical protein